MEQEINRKGKRPTFPEKQVLKQEQQRLLLRLEISISIFCLMYSFQS
jgi:hypothetical protein